MFGKFGYSFRRGYNFIRRLGISAGYKVISGHTVAQLVEALRRKFAVLISDGFSGIPH
jgi:hypothetical protein